MFPGYPASDVRVEVIERELYIDEIKANQRGSQDNLGTWQFPVYQITLRG